MRAAPRSSGARAAAKVDGALLDRFLCAAAKRDPNPKVVIDGDCRVRWCSPGAEKLLEAPMPLCIKGGRLLANEGSGSHAWPPFVENLNETGDRLMLTGRMSGNWILVRGWAEWHGEERIVFLTCALSRPLRSVESSGLAADLGLTKTECAVLDAFARLEKPRQIAERLNISLSTVRSHLKQVHTKTSVNSSVQLLRLTRMYCND